jgi:hypothetical protein
VLIALRSDCSRSTAAVVCILNASTSLFIQQTTPFLFCFLFSLSTSERAGRTARVCKAAGRTLVRRKVWGLWELCKGLGGSVRARW